MKIKEEQIRVAQIVGKMNSGGVESFIMNYYRNIDKNKIQFDFIVDEDSQIPQYNEIVRYGGRVILVPPYQNLISYIKALKEIFKSEKYKIVHSHLNALSVIPLGVAFFSKIPIRIAHSHSTTNKKEWKKNIVKNLLKPFSKLFATHYFACSKHAARWLFGNKSVEKVMIIKNAINLNKFKYDEIIRKEIRKKYNLEKNFVIGHVGRFMKQKNHKFLIEIFRKVYLKEPKSKLLLIGSGELEGDIKNIIKKWNLENAVIFCGDVNNVNEFMQAMDCFVFPSLYEGLGMVLIEAQCSGLKCFGSQEIPQEAVLTELFEYCDLNDSDVWVERILNVKSKRKDCLRKIEACGYEIKNEVKKMEKIYINLLEKI